MPCQTMIRWFLIGSLTPRDVHKCHRTWSPQSRVMACRMIGAEPLPELMIPELMISFCKMNLNITSRLICIKRK